MFNLFEEVTLCFELGRYNNMNHLSRQFKVGVQILFSNFTESRFYYVPKYQLCCLLDFIYVVSISVNGSFILEFKVRFTFYFKLFVKSLRDKKHCAGCSRWLSQFSAFMYNTGHILGRKKFTLEGIFTAFSRKYCHNK